MWERGGEMLLLEHAFERLGCMRVEFKTDARNERSRASLLALPATFEGIFRKHMVVRDGELRDSEFYAITDGLAAVKSEPRAVSRPSSKSASELGAHVALALR